MRSKMCPFSIIFVVVRQLQKNFRQLGCNCSWYWPSYAETYVMWPLFIFGPIATIRPKIE